MSVYIIWPDNRVVSEKQIWTWYHDAVANGEIASRFIPAPDFKTACDALSDAGHVTFGRRNRNG